MIKNNCKYGFAILLCLTMLNLISDKTFGKDITPQKQNSFSLPKTIFTLDKSNLEIRRKYVQDNISLTDFIRNFNFPYSDTYISTLSALSKSGINITSFNSDKGEIFAKLINNKELYVLVIPANGKTTTVRITPSNGVYDIEDEIVREIFKNIKLELASN